ncbi:MAG: ABC transporter ATP-binding protein [Ottowia sp.]|uniref:ABC transporter ATP-binding protein n=1 Tax=Ottowia sp. TaxID=1898956 RepID=UPI003C7207AB
MSDSFALQTRTLDLRFGGNQVLSQVSLGFRAGEITGLIGPNGAGKTSFFNCLSGHYQPTGGDVLFNGQSMNKVSTVQRSRRGLVRSFQHAALCSEMTLVENVMVGLNTTRRSGWLDALLPLPSWWSDREEAKSAGRRALDLVGLGALADLPTAVAAPGVKRLVELARAAVSDPRVILLDEPAAGLNSSETADLARVIKQLRDKDRVILVVEHDMDLIMNVCDRIHVLNFGQVVASGTPPEIQSDARVAEIYLGSPDA